jgi:hypothetical protein
MKASMLKTLAAIMAIAGCSVLRAAPLPEPCVAAYQQDVAGQTYAASSIYTVLRQKELGHCILGPADTTGIEQLKTALLEAKTNGEKAAARRILLERVLAEFDGLPDKPCDGETIACAAGRHVTKIRELQQALDAGPVDPKSVLVSHSSWSFEPAHPTISISQIDLSALLEHECAQDVLSSQCLAAVDFAAKAMRTAEAVHQIIDVYAEPIIEANTQFLTTRDKEWDSYMNQVSVQYPWELGVNGYIFQQVTPKEARSRFPRAPTSKLVVVHPSPGFERVEAPTGGHSTQAAVLIELVGYEKWAWKEGTASNRWGASLVTSFVDARGSQSVGYGVLLKTPFKNASVGVIYRNGDRGRQINLTINVDLAKLIEEYKDVDVKKFLGTVLSGGGN